MMKMTSVYYVFPQHFGTGVRALAIFAEAADAIRFAAERSLPDLPLVVQHWEVSNDDFMRC